MIKRSTLVIIAFLGFLTNSVQAQDPSFSQFYANPLYLNPAFAGTARCPRVCMNFRDQWPNIAGTYVTTSVSYDQYVRGISGGLGVLVTNDRAGAGTLNTLNASLIYAYQLNISPGFSLKFGMQATYGQKYLDWSKLNFGDQIDSRYGFQYNTKETAPSSFTKNYADFSAGFLAYGQHFYVGGAVNHLTRPEVSFWNHAEDRLPMKITAHAGAIIPLKKGNRFVTPVTISPNILYQRQQAFQQLNVGFYVTRGPIVGGFWYRNRDSFIVLVGIQQNFFRIGYSYDITTSKLTNATAGSHEVSMSFFIPCKDPRKRFRTIECPSF